MNLYFNTDTLKITDESGEEYTPDIARSLFISGKVDNLDDNLLSLASVDFNIVQFENLYKYNSKFEVENDAI